LGSPLEASHTERGVTDKLGFDATKPLGERGEQYVRSVIPGFEHGVDIKRYKLAKKER
jgi:2,5-furandicarboxylate decarboxylase 1